MFFKYPKEINKKDFNPLKKDPNALYGLPKEVKYCRKCTISNQRPCSSVEFKNNNNPKQTISFGETGICDACQVSLLKSTINWFEHQK